MNLSVNIENVICVKNIVDEVFQDYKFASMLIAMTKCNFKCFIERNLPPSLCQNFESSKLPDISIKVEDIFMRYKNNPITKAIIFSGLEPFLSFDHILKVVKYMRKNNCFDDIVIYTGYYDYEIKSEIEILKEYKNIIVKFGRFIPNDSEVYDEVLGVKLASKNQRAYRIS